jgi:hypothetical protein
MEGIKSNATVKRSFPSLLQTMDGASGASMRVQEPYIEGE